MRNGRVGCVPSLPVDRSLPQSAYMPHTTGSIECILLWQRQLKRTFTESVSQLLPCMFGHLYSAGGTCVISVVAYSDLTSKSPDYVLSKVGLFSTKLSQTIVPWTLFSRNHEIVSAHARRDKRLLAMVAQSRDHAGVLRNLEIIVCNLGILRMRNAILRLCKFSDCAEHVYASLVI